MKYIDAEKLKEKIQPLYEDAKKSAHFASQTGTSSDCAKYDEAKYIYEYILWLIDALQQEQPEVDLEKEIIVQWSKCNPTDEGMGSEYAIISVEQFDAIVRHFYELDLKAKEE